MSGPIVPLADFCCNFREVICSPFRVGNRVYATDGKILIEVDADPYYCEFQENPNAPDVKTILEEARSRPGTWTEILDWRVVRCRRCNRSGKVSPCFKCETRGYFSIETNGRIYKSDCDICHAIGDVPSDSTSNWKKKCPECDGVGFIPGKQQYAVGTAKVSSSLLKRIINFPDISFKAPELEDDAAKPMEFKFMGGAGIIMPLRSPPPCDDDDEDEDASPHLPEAAEETHSVSPEIVSVTTAEMKELIRSAQLAAADAKLTKEPPPLKDTFFKLYGHGKATLWLALEEKYAELLTPLVHKFFQSSAAFDSQKCAQLLRDAGADEVAIKGILSSCRIDDELYMKTEH